MTNLRLAGFLVVLAIATVSWLLHCGERRFARVAERVAPLEERSCERLTLITVGTGGAHEDPARRGPATAACLGSRVVLVDAGRGLAGALRAARIPVWQPDVVLLTNLLPENSVGLDELLVTGWRQGRPAPLRVVGPAGTRALANSLAEAHAAGIEGLAEALGLSPEAARFEVVEVSDGWAEPGPPAVRAGALPGGPVEAFAYRFEANGRSAVVAGTGWAPDALADLARGADLLLHEAVLVPDSELARRLGVEEDPERLRREAALHTTLDDVGGLAARAGVHALALVRLRPPPVFDAQFVSRVDDDFDGRIWIASDGDEIVP